MIKIPNFSNFIQAYFDINIRICPTLIQIRSVTNISHWRFFNTIFLGGTIEMFNQWFLYDLMYLLNINLKVKSLQHRWVAKAGRMNHEILLWVCTFDVSLKFHHP